MSIPYAEVALQGSLRKTCPKKYHQIHKRTPTSKSDTKKAAAQLIQVALQRGYSPINKFSPPPPPPCYPVLPFPIPSKKKFKLVV